MVRVRNPLVATAMWFLPLLVLASIVSFVLPTLSAGTSTPAAPATRLGWREHVERVDEALGRQNVSAAVFRWHDAYGAALGARSDWRAMAEVGDAAVRIATARAGHAGFVPRAREAYLAAFVRAHQERSREGLERVAEAFSRLGDHGMATAVRRDAERFRS